MQAAVAAPPTSGPNRRSTRVARERTSRSYSRKWRSHRPPRRRSSQFVGLIRNPGKQEAGKSGSRVTRRPFSVIALRGKTRGQLEGHLSLCERTFICFYQKHPFAERKATMSERELVPEGATDSTNSRGRESPEPGFPGRRTFGLAGEVGCNRRPSTLGLLSRYWLPQRHLRAPGCDAAARSSCERCLEQEKLPGSPQASSTPNSTHSDPPIGRQPVREAVP